MAKLFILGLGVDAEHHATIEVLQAMGECAKVFVVGASKTQEKFLARFCAKGALVRVEDETKAASLVSQELKKDAVIGWATPGHPFYWSPSGGKLAAAAAAKGIEWKTFGAISPMGVAISAAGVTLGVDVYGLQAFDAAALASKKGAVLNMEWPLIVSFSPGLSTADYERAMARVKELFGAEHAAFWCPPVGSRQTTVARLPDDFGKLDQATVLYLPAKNAPASKVGWGNESLSKVPKGAQAPEWVKE